MKRVQDFLLGIMDSHLQVGKDIVLDTPLYLQDFKECQQYLITLVSNTSAQSKILITVDVDKAELLNYGDVVVIGNIMCGSWRGRRLDVDSGLLRSPGYPQKSTHPHSTEWHGGCRGSRDTGIKIISIL
jgi:hypothetical protein